MLTGLILRMRRLGELLHLYFSVSGRFYDMLCTLIALLLSYVVYGALDACGKFDAFSLQ